MNRCDWLDQSELRGNPKTRTELGLNTGTTLDGILGLLGEPCCALKFVEGGDGDGVRGSGAGQSETLLRAPAESVRSGLDRGVFDRAVACEMARGRRHGLTVNARVSRRFGFP